MKKEMIDNDGLNRVKLVSSENQIPVDIRAVCARQQRPLHS